jgi:hypothetical protein
MCCTKSWIEAALITAPPENLHGFMEDLILIELFLSRHSSRPGYLYTLSGTNSQESILASGE